MKPRVLAILAACALIAMIIGVATRPGTPPRNTPEKPTTVTPTKPEISPQSDNPPAPAPPVPPAIPPAPVKPRTEESRASGRRDLANPLVPPSFLETTRPAVAAPDSALGPEFDKITVMFRDYRTTIGENPVGTNSEIMKAIMGGNAKGAMLGPPEGQSVNGNGELVDPWGTPYFFHQLTSDLMEIRSAGPDRRMWNEDDIIGK